ncbi:MAG: 50S ribosomal protein L23 [Candidatus Zixiibacteriota bacterium]|nr:MAG: 50S ribosomal protein L23 [candidate division Zixibacteria bacterium]HDL03147.1 50S ribosomal protein L23 [candidate division Zixibacteria bacterium]
MKDPRDVLQLHLMTEKSLTLKESGNAYVFRVNRKANKLQIREAVEKAFNVKVEKVHTMVVPGKPKRLGMYAGRTGAWKKAVVTLKADQKIADFENI